MPSITIHPSTDLFSSSGLTYQSRTLQPVRETDEVDDDNDMPDVSGSSDEEDEGLFSLDPEADGEARITGVVKGKHIVTPGELVTSDSTWMRLVQF